MLNRDFKEFVELLNSTGVEYLIVGGYALAAHGHPRYTGDLDIWIRPSERNVRGLLDVLTRFGFGGLGLTRNDFLQPDAIVQLGYPPSRIDLLTAIDGVEFDACQAGKVIMNIAGVDLPIIGLEEFRANKRASGRAKDLADLESLENASATVPVIAIDGPSASGKGTVASRVAAALGYHYLESGALYRLVALAGGEAPERVAAGMDVEFLHQKIYLNKQDVTDALRSEAMGARASEIAKLPAVRAALLARQRAFRRPPGLVADGRDMGTVVFPDAALKVFLTASVATRAQRRYKQLNDKGNHATLAALSSALEERDKRDAARSVAPLKPAGDAVSVDSSDLTIDEVVGLVLKMYDERKAAHEGKA